MNTRMYPSNILKSDIERYDRDPRKHKEFICDKCDAFIMFDSNWPTISNWFIDKEKYIVLCSDCKPITIRKGIKKKIILDSISGKLR